ncbi:MAG: hypothetical protein ACK54F_01010 [Planctomycetia bacterium]
MRQISEGNEYRRRPAASVAFLLATGVPQAGLVPLVVQRLAAWWMIWRAA